MDQYYNILELPNTATMDEVRKSYNSLYHYYHPDNLKTGNADMFNKLEEAFVAIRNKIERETDLEARKGEIYQKGILDEYIYFMLSTNSDNADYVAQYLQKYLDGSPVAITRAIEYRSQGVPNYRESFVNIGLTPMVVGSITNSNANGYVSHKLQTRYLLEPFKNVYCQFGKDELERWLNDLAAERGDIEYYLNSIMPEEWHREPAALRTMGSQAINLVIKDLNLDYYALKNQEINSLGR